MSGYQAHSEVSVQRYARLAGVLLLLTIVAGFFGELYVPSHLLVAGDGAATAKNLATSRPLFNAGFASYLIEAVCDILLSWIMYVLLRPVHKDIALLAAFLGLVSTSLFAVAEVFFFAPPLLLNAGSSMTAFSTDQVNALMLLSFRLYGRVSGMYMLFYGMAVLIRGYLIVRSRYLPKLIGVLMCVAGGGFIIRNILFVLSPAYASDLLLAPMFLATLSITAWLLVKGIDIDGWSSQIAVGPVQG
jgi:Domain of unknown function (DUF4386)